MINDRGCDGARLFLFERKKIIKMWLIRPILWDDHGQLEVPHIHYIIYIFDKIYTLILIMVKTSHVLW